MKKKKHTYSPNDGNCHLGPVESEMIRLKLVRVVAGHGGDVVGSWCHWFLAVQGRGDLRSCSWV